MLSKVKLSATLLILLLYVCLAGFAGGKQETAAGAPETLEVWIVASLIEAQDAWLKAKGEAWAQDRGVKVNITLLAVEAYAEKLPAFLAAPGRPQVILGGTGHLLAGESGLAIPLDDVVNRLVREDFYEAALRSGEVAEAKTGRKLMAGIPLGFEIRFAEIRSDLLERAGLAIPEKPDYAWLFKAARAMNNPPRTCGLGIALGRCREGYDNVTALIYSFGGGLMADRSEAGGKIFNSKPTWKAFDELKALYQEGVIPPESVGWTDFDNDLAFMEGRAAIVIDGPGIYARMIEEKNPIAKVTLELPLSGARVCAAGGRSLFVLKSSPEKETLAKDLVYTILSDKEDYRINAAEKSGLFSLPVFKSQGAVISRQWREGRYPAFALDPMSSIPSAFCSALLTYPLAEANRVAESLASSLMMPEEWVKLFTRKADSRAVARIIAEKMGKLIAATYP